MSQTDTPAQADRLLVSGRTIGWKGLFLFCAVFFVVGLSVPKVSIVLFVILCLLAMRSKSFFSLDLVLLILFFLLLLLIGLRNGQYRPSFRLYIGDILLPVLAYGAGASFRFEKFHGRHDSILLVFVSFSLGLVVFSALGVSTLLTEKGLLQFIQSRGVRNFWISDPLSDSYFMGAAMVGMLTDLSISLVPLIALYRFLHPKGRRFTVLFYLILVSIPLSFFVDLLLSNRTPFIMLVPEFPLVLWYLKKQKVIHRVSRRLVIPGLATLAFLSYLLFFTHFSEMLIGITARFSEYHWIESARYSIWQSGIANFFYYPFGGMEPPAQFQVRSFHNMWLDVARIGGWLPFIPLIPFQLAQLKYFKRFLARSRFPAGFRVFFLCLGLAIAVSYVSTPVIQGLSVYFAFTFFFLGVVKRLSHVGNPPRFSTPAGGVLEEG